MAEIDRRARFALLYAQISQVIRDVGPQNQLNQLNQQDLQTLIGRLAVSCSNFIDSAPTELINEFPRLRAECFTADKYIAGFKNAITDASLLGIFTSNILDSGDDVPRAINKYRQILYAMSYAEPSISIGLDEARQALMEFKEQFALSDADIETGAKFISAGSHHMYGITSIADRCFVPETVAHMLGQAKTAHDFHWNDRSDNYDEFFQFIDKSFQPATKFVR